MKHAFKSVSAGLLLLAAGLFGPSPAYLTVASAAAAPEQRPDVAPQSASHPALWVLKDDDSIIYLFGTIHALRDGVPWLTPSIRQAFDEAHTLVLETIIPENSAAMQAKLMQHASSSDAKSLSDRLQPEDRAAYHAALAFYAIPAAAFDRFQPWYAATNLSMLPALQAGYNPARGVEARLTVLAKASDKPVEALETIDQQLGIFAKISDAAQIQYLNDSVKLHAETTAMFDRLVAHWLGGQADALGEMMNAALQSSPQLAEALLYQRNDDWAKQLQARLEQPGAQFVAVGAGHLSGDRNVQYYLAQRGLTVERLAD